MVPCQDLRTIYYNLDTSHLPNFTTVAVVHCVIVTAFVVAIVPVIRLYELVEKSRRRRLRRRRCRPNEAAVKIVVVVANEVAAACTLYDWHESTTRGITTNRTVLESLNEGEF